MRVDEAMTKGVRVCHAADTLNEAARQMWENDCGCVVVVDPAGRAIGIVTDRDVCMAAYTRGATLRDHRVSEVMSSQLVTCAPDAPIEKAEILMARHQIRRLPVVDFDERLVGIVSLGDLAQALRHVGRRDDANRSAHALEDTLAAVSQPRSGQPPADSPRRGS
jgi:CBS domain-containing protein